MRERYSRRLPSTGERRGYVRNDPSSLCPTFAPPSSDLSLSIGNHPPDGGGRFEPLASGDRISRIFLGLIGKNNIHDSVLSLHY